MFVQGPNCRQLGEFDIHKGDPMMLIGIDRDLATAAYRLEPTVNVDPAQFEVADATCP